ncbi:class I SAM-dependent methyltransferase [Lentibacter algarum]|uniref:class I SAM-dependent methyltransferase n=1 Tax=Lentibacter algarum TaxID=576131 RepID=UPI001C09A30A|nr:class I SAM-dependent methyltransferase [Lentibacter algarum]MBU2982883.1 class I SAM-dependent methyltransferase [Lentibacter algarum]
MSSNTQPQDAVAFYSEHYAQLENKYNSLSSDEVYAPVAHLLPQPPANCLDIGAGSGRDARWFAELGYNVIAAEPVAGFHDKASHRDPRITWVHDGLPDPSSLLRDARQFDLITLAAVWHHLEPNKRAPAAISLAKLMRPQGRLILSLRHGPSHPGLPVYEVNAADTAALFGTAGFRELERHTAASVQDSNTTAGIRWTWLAFEFEGNNR